MTTALCMPCLFCPAFTFSHKKKGTEQASCSEVAWRGLEEKHPVYSLSHLMHCQLNTEGGPLYNSFPDMAGANVGASCLEL